LRSVAQRQADSKVRAMLNAGRKKSVHISMFGKTHMGLKKELVSRGLSIQETLEYMASLIVEGHPHAIKMLDELQASKHNKEVGKLEEKYAENLYDVIGNEGLFKDD
jgi:predicted nuclease with RNAse H fold